jgi:hypothetical protein
MHERPNAWRLQHEQGWSYIYHSVRACSTEVQQYKETKEQQAFSKTKLLEQRCCTLL